MEREELLAEIRRLLETADDKTLRFILWLLIP